MHDDVLVNKAAIIERCVARAIEEYQADPDSFADNYTRQDAAILNIQRACEAALDMGQYLIRREHLGVPQSARNVFELLAKNQWIDKSLADSLKRMIGFRNIYFARPRLRFSIGCFWPIAALLKQLHSLLCACFSALLSTKNTSL